MIVRLQTCCVEKDMRSASSGTESSCSGKLSISVMCPGHRHERILYYGVSGCRGPRRVDRLGSPWRMVGGEKGWAWGLGRTVEDAHLVPAQRLDDRLELRHGHVVLNTPQRSTPLRAFDSSMAVLHG